MTRQAGEGRAVDDQAAETQARTPSVDDRPVPPGVADDRSDQDNPVGGPWADNGALDGQPAGVGDRRASVAVPAAEHGGDWRARIGGAPARPAVLVPIAPGTNRNDEMALAFELAGARAHQYPLEAIRRGETSLADYQILALPGGFSYGDALGAGRVLGLDLDGWFRDQLEEARSREMPIIGVCNGFQALVHAGLLPGGETRGALVDNVGGRFECRWVHLNPGCRRSVWTAELDGPIWCPVAHGEGRYVSDNTRLLVEDDLVAFRYCQPDGSPADGRYPVNPNGSASDIAGICDPTGLVLGMMPHPEDHVLARQSPHRRRPNGARCLALFSAGVRAVAG